MTSIPHALEALDYAIAEVDGIRKAVKICLAMFKMAGMSLDDRWEYFLKASPLLETESYGDGHYDILSPDGCLYDDIYCERHMTKTYASMDEQVLDTMSEADVYTNDPWQQKRATKGMRWRAHYNEWREAVIKAGYGAFTYDW